MKFVLPWVKPERNHELVKELLALNPDVVIATNAHTTRALQKATANVPIVIALISDGRWPASIRA